MRRMLSICNDDYGAETSVVFNALKSKCLKEPVFTIGGRKIDNVEKWSHLVSHSNAGTWFVDIEPEDVS